jgi:hypothetical protein
MSNVEVLSGLILHVGFMYIGMRAMLSFLEWVETCSLSYERKCGVQLLAIVGSFCWLLWILLAKVPGRG